MATVPRAVTFGQWIEMPKVRDAIAGVVNGEIRITPPNKLLHACVVTQLLRILGRQLDPDTCFVTSAENGLIISRDPLVCTVPDLAVCRNDGLVEQDGYIHSSPELIVEVLPPGNTTRKRADVLQDYAGLGVPEVWVVSPEARTVEILQLHEGNLHTVQLVSQGELVPKCFPRVRVEVSAIWPD